ncbi:hypothetical protein OPKNFCMD_1801 [Methylobacterium crusticola]|uniref:Uncharacterized protein n=1 Tax=Methylobacterium crusticola TaxID=1697972 RepID=A0ABQ4QWW9_9HYPH|nr:DUF6489 family protein [Methylobacterium crusticola]GJD49072.1 hypothetical protein OPKNFCMD_1801 [Methylobacterium crusticola]
MQVTADVDCTPEEARVFLGLPDLQPLQAMVMAHMEKRMLAQLDRYSLDGLMKVWMSALGQPPEPQGSGSRRSGHGTSRPTTR